MKYACENMKLAPYNNGGSLTFPLHNNGGSLTLSRVNLPGRKDLLEAVFLDETNALREHAEELARSLRFFSFERQWKRQQKTTRHFYGSPDRKLYATMKRTVYFISTGHF